MGRNAVKEMLRKW